MSDGRMDKVLAAFLGRRCARLHLGMVVSGVLLAGGIMLLLKVDKTFGILVSAISGLMFVLTVWERLNVKKDRGLVVLRTRPQDVVWAFYETGRVSHILLGLREGGFVAVGNSERWMLDELKPLLPNATTGFSPELEAAFKADPMSVARRAA